MNIPNTKFDDKIDSSSEKTYTSYEFLNDEIDNNSKNNKSNNNIQKYIIDKLLLFYKFKEELIHKIKRKYENFGNSEYFKEYYIINPDWMRNYLKYYNYEKIWCLIKRKSNDKFEKDQLYKEIENNKDNIKESPGKNSEIKDNLSSIQFAPKKVKISRNIYKDDIKDEEIEYFNNFIIVDKKLYNELRQDNKNIDIPLYNFDFEN